jgi:hypothetical protein
VTDKRERVSTDPGLGPLEPPGPSTLRSIEAAEDLSSVSPNAPVYYEPSPLVAVSDHKTLEVETVKLAENIDPRKLATEMRLGRVPSLVPPSDSGWPPQTALSSSTPPDRPSRRRRAPLVLCALLGVLFVLVLARVAARRPASVVGTSSPTAAVAAPAAPPQLASAEVPAAPTPAVADTAVTAAAPEASAEPAHTETKRATSNARQRSAKANSQSAAREPLAAPSSSKPKRAIY